MTVRHPGISPTNDLVAKKIFSNPEITCQFIRDMLDLPAKNVTILEGSNIHVLPSMSYSAQDFYTSIDVLAELDNGTQVIIEIQVHHQNFFINRLWAYLCSQVNQNLEKIRQQEGNTHQSYKHIAPVYAIAIVDSNYFSDDLAFHSFSMREDTTGEVLTITNNGQENHLVKMVFLTVSAGFTTTPQTQRRSCPIAHLQPQRLKDVGEPYLKKQAVFHVLSPFPQLVPRHSPVLTMLVLHAYVVD